jgi:cell division protein FtsN
LLYRLQVGAFLHEKNATNVYARLEAAGFNPAFERYDRYWRVVLPRVRAVEIDDIAWRLGAAGFSEALLREEAGSAPLISDPMGYKSVNPPLIYSGIVPARIIPQQPTSSGTEIYRLQLGSFSQEENAANVVARLRAAGFAPVFERYDRYWRVVLPGIRAHEIDDIARRLGVAGFSEVLPRK